MTFEHASSGTGFSKRDLAWLLFKRKYQVGAILLFAIVFTAISSYIFPRSYEAYASLFVERSAPAVPAASPGTMRMVLDRKEMLNSEIDFITSRAVLDRVAEILLEAAGERGPRRLPDDASLFLRLKFALAEGAAELRGALVDAGLIDRQSEREGLVTWLQSSLEAEPAINSNMITVSLRADNPEHAARVVNHVIRVYLEARLALVKRHGLYDFYDEQIAVSRERLENLDSQARALKSEAELIAPSAEIQLRLQQLTDLDTDLKRAYTEREELVRKIEALRKQVSAQPPEVTTLRQTVRNPQVDELHRKLIDLQTERAREIERFLPESRKITDIDRAIANVRAAIEQAPATIAQGESMAVNEVRQNLEVLLRQTEADYEAKSERVAALAAQMDDIRAELQKLDEYATRIDRLTASAASAEKTYFRYLEQQEEARIEDATNASMTNVRIVHEAAVPERPTRSRLLDILIAGVLALLLGLGYAFVAEFFDHSLEDKDDVERFLGLPLLASLPELRSVPRLLRR